MHHRTLPLLIAVLLSGQIGLGSSAFAQGRPLRSQLETLARDSGFVLEGLDQLGPEKAVAASGDVQERLKALLANYNYVLIQAGGGRIERVTITSLKQAPQDKPSGNAYVKTQRMGTHHQVEATLTGPNGSQTTVTMLVDTGATTLVLPESMIDTLGFKREELEPGMSQTANDMTPIKLGVLKTVWVGNVSADNVKVAFIEDKRLHHVTLLGMSFLNRFRFSLDDDNNELILLSK